MAICADTASSEELACAERLRHPFLIPGYPEPYMLDIVRAFRLLRGRRSYLEIGTFDRGNLAFTSTLLADDAVLIGVDTQDEQRRDALLSASLKPGQRYVSIVGDSRHRETVERVNAFLRSSGLASLDAVFIDGNHIGSAVMSDYANFGGMVASGGIVMFHDSLWEGDTQFKGVADALAEIDKVDPIYLVPGEGPCHRFMRTMSREAQWGVRDALHCLSII
jgi:predicted O-methyltransferase YrrM